MFKKNLFQFLKSNTQGLPIGLGDSKSLAIELFGKPKEIVGDDSMGFIYFRNGIRISYDDDIINEIGIDICNTKKSYPVKNKEDGVKGVLNRNTPIHKILDLLSTCGIRYRFISINDQNDYLCVVTEGNVALYFSVYDDQLTLIAYTGVAKFDRIPLTYQVLGEGS